MHPDDSSKADPKNQASRGELFLVATPIGNLGDITLRALEILKQVDQIACEYTRVSGGLLHHFGIKKPLIAYHAHNEAELAERLVAGLARGQRIALISDAGTPLLSDPGARLVDAAVAAGIRVTPIPGASALLAGLTISGLSAQQFFYAGFLPVKGRERSEQLTLLSRLPVTFVCYEAPHRLLETLSDLHQVCGDRKAAVARELTKLHEECTRLPLSALMKHFTNHAPRGECVIIVEAAAPPAQLDEAGVDHALREAMQTLRVKEAAAEVSALTGISKSVLYARALQLKDGA